MHGLAGDRNVGRQYKTLELATILNRQAEILRANEGGVTFSGGEPLMQAEFVAEVCDLLSPIHIVLDTSGYAAAPLFRLVAEKCDLVHYDLKIIDPQAHLRFTGVKNHLILSNLRLLSTLGVPFVVRVPLVPGVTDTDNNLTSIADTVQLLPGLLRVDLLPYNRAAGGKYPSLGMEFRPGFDEKQEINPNTKPFERRDIPVHVAGTEHNVIRCSSVHPGGQMLR
jgi:pyruvate formate lyase activating enzyme